MIWFVLVRKGLAGYREIADCVLELGDAADGLRGQ